MHAPFFHINLETYTVRETLKMNCDSNKPDIKLPVKWPNDIFYLMGLRRSCSIEIQKMYIQIILRILKKYGN